MHTIAIYDTKPYDKTYFEKLNPGYDLRFIEPTLTDSTVPLAAGADAVCAFVHDELTASVIDRLYEIGVRAAVMRCAGYQNVDFRAAYKKIHVMRVPAYSPYAVAEHAAALLLTLNRKTHRAYNRTREFNFSLVGLTGMDLHGKTAGVIGTGRIGRAFIDICRGFGMNVLAYDAFPNASLPVKYVSLDELYAGSDVISLHCPLTDETHHMLSSEAFGKMKPGVIVINTSRGGLIDSAALLAALRSRHIGAAGLDVYEEEAEYFYEDHSSYGISDDTLSLLTSMPNVLLTSHQAFLTDEALGNIAATTFENLNAFFSGAPLDNEVCYVCSDGRSRKDCVKEGRTRCF